MGLTDKFRKKKTPQQLLNEGLVEAAKHRKSAGVEIERLLNEGADPHSVEAESAVNLLIYDEIEWNKDSASIKQALRAFAESGNELTWLQVMAYSFDRKDHYVREFAEEVKTPGWLNERLYDAINRGDISRVKRILQAGGDPNGKDQYDEPLLLLFITRWYPGDTATTTVREGIQGGTVAIYEPSAMSSTEKKYVDIARILIEAGFDVMQPSIVKAAEAQKGKNAVADFVAAEIKKRQAVLPPSSPPKHGPLL
jgi:hypothetical protein